MALCLQPFPPLALDGGVWLDSRSGCVPSWRKSTATYKRRLRGSHKCTGRGDEEKIQVSSGMKF